MKLTVFIPTNASEKRDDFLFNHINETIGLYYKDYEVVFFENHNAQYSLTKAYNIGLKSSNSDYVVFMHNDIEFLEEGWGRKIINYFDKTEYGILGVAGTTDLLSGKWWESQKDMVGAVKHQRGPSKWITTYSPKHTVPTEVVAIDGVCFAVNKKRIKVNFDDTLFNGFHFYDIDFCIANFLEGVKIAVVHDIPILHYSVGETDNTWETNKFFLEQKYNGKFPLSVSPKIEYDTSFVNPKGKDKVSVVILSYVDDKSLQLVEDCLESFDKKVKYKNYEIILGINHPNLAEEKNLVRKFESLCNKYDKLKIEKFDYYNFAKLNNELVYNVVDKNSKYILFCNNDIELLNDVVSRMVKTYQEEETIATLAGAKLTLGTIGARLHYPEKSEGKGRLQHAGVFCIKQQNNFNVGHIGYKSYYGYESKQVFANTGALMMVRKEDFLNLKGFNTDYEECFEDVQLNLELILNNKINYIDSESVAIHKESITRGFDNNKIASNLKVLIPRIAAAYDKKPLLQFFVKNV